jgi:ElaB/YqjD/DUF883 family membrane-anchored ribosome-binding protein
MNTTNHRERLTADLKAVLHDAEDLLRATAHDVSDKASAARVKLGKSLDDAKVRLTQVEEKVVEKGKEAAKATDEYVHEHPWQAVGVAAAIGLLLGLAVSRR